MTRDPQRYATTDGEPADTACEATGAPKPINPETGQHRAYWVLSEAERAKGFVRPLRDTYRHVSCGSRTTMLRAIAETYAREPRFYGATFCCSCGSHYPVAEFRWVSESGAVTDEVLGS